MYAELINDRSFGGLAYSLGLSYSVTNNIHVPTSSFEHEYLPFADSVELYSPNPKDPDLTGIQRWRSTAPLEYRCGLHAALFNSLSMIARCQGFFH